MAVRKKSAAKPAAKKPEAERRLLERANARPPAYNPLLGLSEVEKRIYLDTAGGGETSRLAALAALRRIARRSPLAQAYINQVRQNVVGDVAPTPTFSGVVNKRDRAQLQRMWRKWSADPSVNGGESLAGMLRSMVASMAVDGRVFGIMRRSREYPCGLAVMPLERDWLVDEGYDSRVEYELDGVKREGVNGVIRTAAGRTSHYVFYGKPDPTDVAGQHRSGGYSSPTTRSVERVAVPADMVLDLFCARNASDVDGSPSHLLPALRKMDEIARLDDAVVRGMEITAVKMGFITKSVEAPSLAQQQREDKGLKGPPRNWAHRIEELPTGYDFKSFDPEAPNADISRYRMEVIQTAAASLGMDHASLAGDLRDVNYSSIRAGIVAARDMYRVWQEEVERKVLRPVLTRLLDSAEDLGELRISGVSRDAALDTEWRHRSWSWVDPLKDAQAAMKEIEMGIQSPQNLAQQRGRDFDQIMMELAEAKKAMDKAGLLMPGSAPMEEEVEDGDDDEGEED